MVTLHTLVIDDVKQNAELIEEYLSGLNYNVDTAYDGEQAIELISSHSYDIIITDVLMPKKDGYEVAKFAKEKSAKTFVIAMSGGSAMIPQRMALQGISLYADATIKKPFSPDELSEKIKNLVKN